jgi:hypothetical protein
LALTLIRTPLSWIRARALSAANNQHFFTRTGRVLGASLLSATGLPATFDSCSGLALQLVAFLVLQSCTWLGLWGCCNRSWFRWSEWLSAWPEWGVWSRVISRLWLVSKQAATVVRESSLPIRTLDAPLGWPVRAACICSRLLAGKHHPVGTADPCLLHQQNQWFLYWPTRCVCGFQACLYSNGHIGSLLTT